MRKFLLFVAAVLVFGISIGSAVIGVVRYQNRMASPVVHSVPPQNKTAPPEFLSDYDNFSKEKDAVLKVQKDNNLQYRYDALKSWGDRLGREVPQGYQFDELTRSFAPIPQQPTPATAQPPEVKK